MKTFLLLMSVFLIQVVQAQSEYRFLDRGQFKLAYRTFGEGDPVFILNGGPGRSSDTFIPLAKSISQLGYKTILFDQRGTGASKLPLVDASTIKLDLMLEDLDELRKELKYEKITVLGHSFGGIYALSYASKYPANLKSLILSESPGPDLSWQSYANSNMLSRLTLEERKSVEFWNKKDTAEGHLKAMKILAAAYVYNRKFVPEIAKSLTNLKVYFPQINQLLWQDMENFDLKGKFETFTAPTLIIHGRQDFLGEAVALANHKELKNSQLQFLNECSHYPWYDQPKKYFELIGNFLKNAPH